ncbi:MAG: mechanosensitive ion channel family protein [Bacteroidales bacterium]|jgi:small conductance mechanosensitive channel|nr:mechanosensitive ion channel family protein [Bacteroidales bacterium]
MEKLFSNYGMVSAMLTALFWKIIAAIVVYIIGKWVINKVCKISTKMMDKKGIENSLQGFLESIIKVVLWLCLIIAIINILGVDTAAFVGLFAGAGVAIGMAMSGTLGNFAGGVMILLFKPFKVGDYIAAQGYEGVVKDIQIFNTVLVTTDNKTIIIPNGGLSTGSMVNYSKQPYRRADVNFDFCYGADYEKVREAIEKIQNACPLILKEPIEGEPVAGPWQGLANMGESGCTIATRSWCKSADYWAVVGYMNHEVYQQLRESGFMFPFNKLDVKIIKD